MPIKGSLEEASVQDVLQLLSLGRKTGCLSITNWANLGHIYVAQGRIIHADVVNRRDRLGDVLVRRGRITQEQLDEAIRLQDQNRDKKIGEILLELGAISSEELERHVRLQIEEAMYFLLTWNQGSFTFEAGAAPSSNEFLVSIESESLLLEGARRTDEWPRIEKEIPSFGIVFKVDQKRLASSEKTLTSEQMRIAPLLDGSHDVGEIVDQTGLAEFDVAKAVHGLVTSGLAQKVARRNSDRRLSRSGVRLDVEPETPTQETVVVQHLDDAQLSEYVEREGPYADAKHRREVAFHICDCAVCSKRLKELHKRRSVELKSRPSPQPEQAPPGEQIRRSGERRTGIDRRQSDPAVPGTAEGRKRRATAAASRGAGAGKREAESRTGIDRRESNRRETATEPAPSTPKKSGAVMATRGRKAAKERRSGVERREGERRGGERRSRTSVDRGDKYSVERRARPERRAAERRTSARRATDRVKMPTGQAAGRGGGGAASPAVAAPAPAQKRAPRRSAPSERRKTRPEAPAPAAKKKAKGAKDHRPKLRLTEDERQSLAGLPLIEEPMLAKPGTPRTSLPPAPRAKAQQQEFVAEVTGAKAGPAAAKQQPAGTPRVRIALIGAVAVIAVMVGWFGRPIMRSVMGGDGSVTSVEEGMQAGTPAVASAATIESGDDVGTETVADSQVPLQEPPAEQLQTPPVQAEPPPRDRAAPVVTAPVAVQQVPEPTPAVELPRLVGTVRAARSGAPLPGVRVAVQGTNLAVTTDASGSFEIVGVPASSFSVRLSLDGFLTATEQVAGGGSEAPLDLSLESPPNAREPDAELGDEGWVITDHAGAEDVLGRPVTIVGGLWVESIARPAEGARRRVRVAQLTQSGERVVLTVTLTGPANSPSPPQVTAIRVRSASGGTSMAMGTASFGNLLVSAKSLLPADSLRVQLQRLQESYDAEERQ